MARNRSVSCKYPSRHGLSRFVTAAQYIAELLCERQARQQKRTLPLQFWNSREWSKVYVQQVIAANRLINHLDPKVEGKRKGTGEKALSRFLRSPRGKDIYSLTAPWVIPLVEAAHRDLLCQQEDSTMPPPPPQPEAEPYVPEPPRPPFVRGMSLLNKLRRIEDAHSDGDGR